MTGDTETRRASVRRARSARLPRSPAGRPACSAPPLGRPPPAGRRSDRCCPCYPGTCICGGWTQTVQAKSPTCQAVMLLCTSGWRCVGGGAKKKNAFLPFIVENAVGHVQRSQEGPDVVIRPVLQSRGKQRQSVSWCISWGFV